MEQEKLNGSNMKDRSNDPSHKERPLLRRSYISILLFQHVIRTLKGFQWKFAIELLFCFVAFCVFFVVAVCVCVCVFVFMTIFRIIYNFKL